MELRAYYIPEFTLQRKRRAKRLPTLKKKKQEYIEKPQPEKITKKKKIIKKKVKQEKPMAEIKQQKVKDKRQRKIQEKRQEREYKLEGQLLRQLTMVQERIDRMDRDKELYYLLGYEKDDKNILTFTIMKKHDDKKVKIKVYPDQETNCSCMDWRIRCKQMGIACKHLYYLLHKMLNYSLYEYYDNRIMNWELFKEQVKLRMRMNDKFEVSKDVKLAEEICPICFMDFKDDQVNLVKQCPDCKNLVHQECMRIWIENSEKRNCVICRSEAWNLDLWKQLFFLNQFLQFFINQQILLFFLILILLLLIYCILNNLFHFLLNLSTLMPMVVISNLYHFMLLFISMLSLNI